MIEGNPFNWPLCPERCGGVLTPVSHPAGSMLNAEQFDAIRAGDWYCTRCKGDRSNTGFRYFWNREIAGVQP